MAKRDEIKTELVVQEIEFGAAEFCLVGLSPLLLNRMSEKARQQLLYPRAGRMGTAEKASNMKHDPLEEYRASAYTWSDNIHATRVKFPATSIKKSLAQAAIDIPGAARSELGRLVSAQWQDVDVYGTPKMSMMVTRMKDIGKTPDIRTRAILPRWATRVTLNYMQPKLNFQSVANLLAAAGRIVGIGDGRPEKGTFSFGQFRLVDETDAEYLDILREGRKVQDAAFETPSYYDEETREIFEWYEAERSRRGSDSDSKTAPKKRKKTDDDAI